MQKGPKVDLRVWKELRARVLAAAASDSRVKVGVMASAGHHAESGITMAELAAVHEYGSPANSIPERSFLRKTLDLKAQEIKAKMREVTQAYVEDRISLAQALGLVGQWMVTQVRLTITSQQVRPRLDESEAGRRTIEKKGSSVTLVDTGQLLNSISYEVESEGAAPDEGAGAEE